MSKIYFESGAYGNADNIVFVEAPEVTPESDSDMEEYVEEQTQVSLSDIFQVLRNARDGSGDWRGQVDDVLDFFGEE